MNLCASQSAYMGDGGYEVGKNYLVYAESRSVKM